MSRIYFAIWMPFLVTASLSMATDNVHSENVAFELPDVIALESSARDRYRLEAFKDKSNDRMLDEGSARRLRWVSLGRPRLVRTRRSEKSSEQPRLFHAQADGFYASVDTLTEREAELLASAAGRKYGVPVAAEQILPLTPGRFECRFSLPNGGLLRGSVFDFQALPLRLHFLSPAAASPEHKAFVDALKDEDNVDASVVCEVHSQGFTKRVNRLHVDSKQLRDLKLVDGVFGPAAEVFVTRMQLTQLTHQLHSSLDVEEEYEVPEERFGEEAVRQIVEQSAASGFSYVPASEALAELSPYRLDFSNDLRADEFSRIFFDNFHLKGTDSKNRTRSDDRLLQMLLLQWRVMIGGGGGIAFGNFSMGGGGEINTNGSALLLQLLQSYEDQLRQEKRLDVGDVRFELEGHRVVPKSILATRLTRSSFDRGFSFGRVRRIVYSAPFSRTFELQTLDASTETQASCEKLTAYVQKLEREISSCKAGIKKTQL